MYMTIMAQYECYNRWNVIAEGIPITMGTVVLKRIQNKNKRFHV